MSFISFQVGGVCLLASIRDQSRDLFLGCGIDIDGITGRFVYLFVCVDECPRSRSFAVISSFIFGYIDQLNGGLEIVWCRC